MKWAGDPAVLAKRIEGALRESTNKMSAVRLGTPLPQRAVQAPTAPPPSTADVRTRGGRVLSNVSFAKLVEIDHHRRARCRG